MASSSCTRFGDRKNPNILEELSRTYEKYFNGLGDIFNHLVAPLAGASGHTPSPIYGQSGFGYIPYLNIYSPEAFIFGIQIRLSAVS